MNFQGKGFLVSVAHKCETNYNWLRDKGEIKLVYSIQVHLQHGNKSYSQVTVMKSGRETPLKETDKITAIIAVD